MKIQDLMIGDWVYNKHHKKNIRITPYDYFTHGHKDDGTQYFPVTCPTPTIGKDLEPIPITSEILEKNGFSVGSNMSIYKDDEFDDCEINFWNFEKFCIVQNYETNVEIDFFCKSVHELQHALRLCGIKKEIEL